MNNFCTFYIVRHGQSEDNLKGITSGSKNPNLSQHGKEQAIERGKEFRDIHFSAVFSSDFTRSKETARLLVNNEVAVEAKDALKERMWGELEGKSKKNLQGKLRELRDAYNKLSYKEKYKVSFAKGMETDEQMMGRFITFLREVALGYSGKNVLIVTHGNIMRTFLMHLGWATSQELPSESVKNLGYMIVKSDGVEFEVVKTVGIDKAIARSIPF